MVEIHTKTESTSASIGNSHSCSSDIESASSMARIRRCIVLDVPEASVTKVTPLLALENEAVVAENNQVWVLLEDFEDGSDDLVSSESMSITSTSPDVDKATILLGSASQE